MDDFQRLLIADTYIKILKKDNENLSNNNTNLNNELTKLKREREEVLKNWNKGEVRMIKKDEFVKKLESKIEKLKQENNLLYRDNQELIIKLHQK